jgi:RNA polymerase sigma factor (sigma-70 family)
MGTDITSGASTNDEPAIRGACEAGDIDAATAGALRLYGAEVFGLLVALQEDADGADDAFSLFAERLWRTLGGFGWRWSLRTWVYRVARNASADVTRQARRAERGRAHLPGDAIEEVKQQVRTETLSLLRTAKRTQLEGLRGELPEDDRALLILRVDREMPWRDVARIMSDLAADDEATLGHESARLRKRFQLVKARLRELGKERGLL